MRNARLEVQIFIGAKIVSPFINPIAYRARQYEADFLTLVRHRPYARVGAGREDAKPGFQHAGEKVAREILQDQTHFRIFDRIARRAADDNAALRPFAKAGNEKAEILLQCRGEIDGVDQARPQLSVLDLANP